jgi:hypothetical protein
MTKDELISLVTELRKEIKALKIEARDTAEN